MSKVYVNISLVLISLMWHACSGTAPTQTLEVVTYSQFEEFVNETEYLTDAEQFGWSIVQQDVYNFITVDGATWRKPDGLNPPVSKEFPVTQVSYNDAMAYCKWAGTELPTYDQYWQFIKNDHRKVVTNNDAPISNANEVNILGNVWEITLSERGEETRLAGGSLFCSPTTCNGTSAKRQLYVDKQTGNIHIGFAVIKQSN